MAIITPVTIIDENDDKIEVYVNTENEITITVDAEPVSVLTSTDARALARLILDAAVLAEEEQEENKTIFCP